MKVVDRENDGRPDSSSFFLTNIILIDSINYKKYLYIFLEDQIRTQ